MSNFCKWWSAQHNNDKAAKQFASIVWQEAAKPYQESIASLSATIEAQSKGIKQRQKINNELTAELFRYKAALERIVALKFPDYSVAQCQKIAQEALDHENL